MNYKRFFFTFGILVCSGMIMVASLIFYLDPVFHFGRPRPEYYYPLNSQRYQNDGILKHFDYEAIITGTSMTENFKTTEFENLFGIKAVKVPYAGARFKETSDAIKVAFKSGHNVKIVIISFGNSAMMANKDDMRIDLGEYPEYLYNDCLYDDVKYLLNKDVLVKQCFVILKNRFNGRKGGVTDFDSYSNWGKSNEYKYGREFVLNNDFKIGKKCKSKQFSSVDEQRLRENINQNIIELAKQHPKTIFYYFYPPYSIVNYANLVKNGELERIIQAKTISAEMMLEYSNIKLYSFNLMTEIITDLNNYKDATHYGEWINSDILRYMKEDVGLLTKENYQDYLRKELELYMNYSYELI